MFTDSLCGTQHIYILYFSGFEQLAHITDGIALAPVNIVTNVRNEFQRLMIAPLQMLSSPTASHDVSLKSKSD